jgi:hypothetical protein
MLRSPVVALILVLPVVCASCSYNPGKSSAPADLRTSSAPAEGTDSTPTKEELLIYLHGKTVDVGQRSTDKGKKTSFSIDRTKITALELGTSSYKANDEPWHSSCTFLYDAGDGVRYAVEADFEHRKVDNKRAFFGLNVKRVAEQ